MQVEGPAPGEELNEGEPTEPRQAASVIVLRGGGDGLEVLLLRRNPASRFMGGAWVFPGGAVDVSDVAACPACAGEAGLIGEGESDEGASRLAGETDLPDAAHRVAAVREVEEEAGLRLPDPDALVEFSRWITPPQITIRYDTHFFLARAPHGQEPRIDGGEMVGLGWHTPAGALDAHRRGELDLVFPTIKHLEQLAGFGSADELLEWAAGREVVAVEPHVRITGETARVVLPGEPGY
jgi:8-oxo-dGTP pyrophosphatase MutT (NUDIX family)